VWKTSLFKRPLTRENPERRGGRKRRTRAYCYEPSIKMALVSCMCNWIILYFFLNHRRSKGACRTNPLDRRSVGLLAAYEHHSGAVPPAKTQSIQNLRRALNIQFDNRIGFLLRQTRSLSQEFPERSSRNNATWKYIYLTRTLFKVVPSMQRRDRVFKASVAFPNASTGRVLNSSVTAFWMSSMFSDPSPFNSNLSFGSAK